VTKEEALAHLWGEIRATLKDKKKLVFGEGSVDARLAVVGEAPGREEEEMGRPFVGRAGWLLDQLLPGSGLKREEMWITNVVKWQPTRGDRGTATRAPTVKEMEQGAQWLKKELELIGCQFVLALGSTAARTLVSDDFKMNQQHGQWHQGEWGHQVLVTFHPAYALRPRADDGETVIDRMRQGLQRVKERYVD